VTVTTRVIAAPPETVDDVLSEPDTYPAWLVGARRMRSVDADFPAPGSGFDHEVGAGPVRIDDRSDVIGREPGRRLRMVVRARPLLVAEVDFELEPVAGGTRVRMTETPKGWHRWYAFLVEPLVRIRNERSLSRLAQLIERPGGDAGASGATGSGTRP
jgi:uncharacterized protein YndB with AHSA1/START domain